MKLPYCVSDAGPKWGFQVQQFKILIRIGAALSGLVLGACSGQHQPISINPNTSTARAADVDNQPLTFEGVTKAVFAAKCLDCHGGTSATGQKTLKADIDLTNYESLFGGADPLLVKGDPEGGLIMAVLRTGEMPDDGRPRVSHEELKFLKAWVLAGAPVNAIAEVDSETESGSAGVAVPELPIIPPIIGEAFPEEPVVESPTDVGPIIEGETVTFERVFAEVLEPKCSRCHSGIMGEAFVDVTDLEALKNNFMFTDLLKKGSPLESRLYRVVESGRMPYRGDRLTRRELELIRLWIYEGKDL